jgi:hypothetical protein
MPVARELMVVMLPAQRGDVEETSSYLGDARVLLELGLLLAWLNS